MQEQLDSNGLIHNDTNSEVVSIDTNTVQLAERKNAGKAKLSLVDLSCMEPAAHVLENSLNSGKYGRNDWQKGFPISSIIDSLLRHIGRLQKGEWIDKDSGLPHVGHIQCNALFLGNMENNVNDLTKGG